jgi:hypothetical protein
MWLQLAVLWAAADVTVALDTLFYQDDDNVTVVSPQLTARGELDDDGSEVSARVVVDAITAASVDVISQATTRFDDQRVEVGLGGARRFGAWLPRAAYRFSLESDYLSNGGALGVRRRVAGADATIDAQYALTWDVVGRHGTSFDDWSRNMATHELELAYTQVLDPRTVVRLVGSFTAQAGYLAKPYRFVPLFDAAGVAAAGELTLDNFAEFSLPARPPERVPDLRLRPAVAVRALRRIDLIDGSLRADYRFYADSWGMVANTAELAVNLGLRRGLRLEVRDRVHQQSAVDFWERAYVVADETMLPRYRTLDRELGPSISNTASLAVSFQRGAWAGYGEVGAMYSKFQDFLLLDDRIAFVSQLGVRWTP